jgi:protein involved in polysaccharide export with SLBB domain
MNMSLRPPTLLLSLLAAFSLVSYLPGIKRAKGAEPARDSISTRPIGVSAIEQPAPAPVGPGAYLLDRGDRLRIVFFERSDLTGEYRIKEDGQIKIPQVGGFEAVGRSTIDLENEIRSVFSGLPQGTTNISVEVLERRPFFVVGLVSKPGAYPFVPGMTVMHAMAYAGGIYRPAGGSYPAAEAIREQGRIQQMTELLKRALVRQARLQAELEGKDTLVAPPSLTALVGQAAADVLCAPESIILTQQLATLARTKAALRITVDQSQNEVDALNTQIVRMAEERAIRDKQAKFLKGLSDRGLVNQQRLFDAEMAASLIARDSQSAIAGIARAQTTLETAKRDLDLLALSNTSKLQTEIVKLDEEIEKARSSIANSGKYIAQLEETPTALLALTTGKQEVLFEIVRSNSLGETKIIKADDLVTMLPNDVLRVNLRETR